MSSQLIGINEQGLLCDLDVLGLQIAAKPENYNLNMPLRRDKGTERLRDLSAVTQPVCRERPSGSRACHHRRKHEGLPHGLSVGTVGPFQPS